MHVIGNFATDCTGALQMAMSLDFQKANGHPDEVDTFFCCATIGDTEDTRKVSRRH
jgi:hypothetical protein